jgi:hypothetical protein
MTKKVPKNLKKTGRAFWNRTIEEFSLENDFQFETLKLAAESLDFIELARVQVQKDGGFYTDRYGGVKESPAHETIRRYGKVFLQAIRELGLNLETESESPRIKGRY